MTKPSTRRRIASVQQHYVRAREIMGEVLCLYAPLSPTRRSYRVVLEVSTINFLLKAPEEQDALVERYRSLLKALTFPVQIVVRNMHLDLHPYLERIQAHIPLSEGPLPSASAQTDGEQVWAELAEGLETLLQQIGSRRTLIQRHCYLIVPAPDLVPASHGLFLRRKRRRAHQHDLVGRALQELALRVETIQTQLAALGLRSHRVLGEDLARVYQSFMTPERALAHPLRREHLAAVGHVPRVLRSSVSSSLRMVAPESTDSFSLPERSSHHEK